MIRLALALLLSVASAPCMAETVDYGGGNGVWDRDLQGEDITDSIDDVTKEDIEPGDTPKEGNENVPKDD